MSTSGTHQPVGGPWLLAATVAFTLAGVHSTGAADLRGLNPVYLGGCGPTLLQGVRRVAVRQTPGVAGGLTLVRAAPDGEPEVLSLAAGQAIMGPLTDQVFVLVGVTEDLASLRVLDLLGQEQDWPVSDLDMIRLTDGITLGDTTGDGALYGAMVGGAPVGLPLLLFIPCAILAGGGPGNALEDEVVQSVIIAGVITPAAVGAAIGAGIGGISYGSRRPPRGLELGPGAWEVAGGRGVAQVIMAGQLPSIRPVEPAPLAQPMVVAPAPPVVAPPPTAGWLPAPLTVSPDDPSCTQASSLPPGCACGTHSVCASGLCGSGAPRRCAGHCPLGCGPGQTCVIPPAGGSARCAVAP